VPVQRTRAVHWREWNGLSNLKEGRKPTRKQTTNKNQSEWMEARRKAKKANNND